SSCTAWASATRSRSRACTAMEPATSSTRSSTTSRCTEQAAGRRSRMTRFALRSSAGRTSASRASSTSCSAASASLSARVPARDAIATVLERGDRTFLLVDTAGLRRKRRHRQGIEYYSELRALEAAERADVALVLIDSSQGVVDQDLAVADVARKADDATLIV